MKTTLSSRRDRYFARFSILLIMVALIAGMVGCDGNTNGIVEIRDWGDLDKIRYDLGSRYVLVNDLDSTSPGYGDLASQAAHEENGWKPIVTFTGNFNGGGYEIRDLFINRAEESSVGLFGCVGRKGVVENVKVVNATVTGKDSVGGLVGQNDYGSVSDSYSTGSVKGEDDVGGLVGQNDHGSVTNSSSSCNVNGDEKVGGLVGQNNYGSVSDSYSTGSVKGEDDIGGLVGHNDYGSVSSSNSSGSVSGGLSVGGLVGCNQGPV